MSSIPEKLYYKIGEVAQVAEVEPYVLRYWESEFREIAPVKSKSNQRLYRKKDIETVLLIKKLLYSEGFTIEGARRKIRDMHRHDRADPAGSAGVAETSQMSFLPEEVVEEASVVPKADLRFLKNIKKELEELFQMLQTSSPFRSE